MRLLYTHDNPLIVHNAKNILENAGIEVTLKNEFAMGGVGELSAINTWPELWVNESQYDQAREAINDLTNEGNQPDWSCNNCGEVNDGRFSACWKCEKEINSR